jgi:hypothetical protein
MADRTKGWVEYSFGPILGRLERENDVTQALLRHSQERIRQSLEILKRFEPPEEAK